MTRSAPLQSQVVAIEAPSARKSPMQERSKARVERILEAAGELIVRGGSDQLKMSEVAASAGISIGSLYQYFPEKAALIRMLAERINAQSRECIREGLKDVSDLASLKTSFAALVDTYYAIVSEHPVMRDIWSGMQADRQLLALQVAESRACGQMLAEAMHKVHGRAQARRIGQTAFLIWEMGEATIRLAIAVDPAEGAALVETFKRMALREIAEPRA
ncbi:TetR/AcrR family transcriptional regulator [Variovorax boronicumulans]|uniref:TetR/AcrR family transcriptional regulator n=1 Tax=Variovorax boronicumulans TaxID=436515 RepID=UPI0033910B2F